MRIQAATEKGHPPPEARFQGSSSPLVTEASRHEKYSLSMKTGAGWLTTGQRRSREPIQISWLCIRSGPSGLPGVPESRQECALLPELQPHPGSWD